MNDFIASLMLLGAMGSGDSYLPYWMTTNQYGLMPERDGAMALFQAGTSFDDTKTLQWRWGTSLALNDYNNPLDPGSSPVHLMVDELYGSLKWKCFTLDLGSRHRELDFYGASEALGSLSVTGGHVVESGNARTQPGYLITLDPVAVPFTNHKLFLSGAYGDYKPTDVRYVQGALIHRTRIGFTLKPAKRLTLDFLLDHYAIWGGESPQYGTLPKSFENYVRVVLGRPASADGPQTDRENVLGDQGGSENFRASWQGNGWKLTAQHDIPYADGSGMGFQNFPDGVNTIAFSFDDKHRWVSDILYEYHYTMYQSGPFQHEVFDEDGHKVRGTGFKTTGGDNYFANGEFKSGWTHYGRLIGDPMCLPEGVHAGTWTSANVNIGIENNRYKAHHFALGGSLFRKHPYRLMMTYSKNYGTYFGPYKGESQWDHEWGTVKETPLKQFSFGLNGRIVNLFKVNGLDACYGFFFDKGELLQNSFGATIGVQYSIGKGVRP